MKTVIAARALTNPRRDTTIDREPRLGAVAQTTSDNVLIGRIAGGDRLAMQVLYARHHVRVFRFALRLLRDATSAEDATSEVFLDVWRQAGRFEARSTVTTWLLTIARFKALSILRRKPEAELTNEMVETIEDSSDTPETALQTKDERQALRQCLESLSTQHREVVDLVYYHGKTVEEVAELIGVCEGTVRTRMFYARKRLAELLRTMGVERNPPRS